MTSFTELCEAILDDDDRDVWRLGLEALAMIARVVAVPAVRRLRSHPGLRPLATDVARPQRLSAEPSGMSATGVCSAERDRSHFRRADPW
jgi:hypothetical protein